jgi:preprotein translocase subunit SecD
MHYFFHETLSFLCFFLISIAQVFPFFQVSPAQVKVEFRLAEMEPGSGLTEAKVDGPLQRVYLHKDAIITNGDISEARASGEPNILGDYEVAVVFKRKAAERLATITKRKKGGLLAIVIDGKVVTAMGIPERIYDRATISGPRTKKEAENLAAMLNPGSGANR